MDKQDLLIEIGTEELPPTALKHLAIAFSDEIQQGLLKKELVHGACQWFATPRRLAVLIRDLASHQPDREVERRGPAVSAAFDAQGRPGKAAEGFARSCGVSVEELGRVASDKGAWLSYKATEKGSATRDLLQEISESALQRLPIPRRMRWGGGAAEFVRPLHWVVMLFGKDPVPCTILGVRATNCSRGHRFHHPQPIPLDSPREYCDRLKAEGQVIVDYRHRQELITVALKACAEDLGGQAIIDADLLDEVTALVEWPVVIAGNFDRKFLQLPNEVLIASMQEHQKYFPVSASDGSLLPCFITVANIDSKDPEAIRRGNERVIFPRLSDAAFFWQRDIARPLADYQDNLEHILYQEKLGSLLAKSRRVAGLATYLATEMAIDSATVARAAMLAKCDLSSAMVGEFPELQGIMGRYYALNSGEDAALAVALDEQYMPRFAGDVLPASRPGQALALADKIDTLVGIFAIGQAPTGDKDPFALRRAAIGCLRIMIECRLDLDLAACLQSSAKLFETDIAAPAIVDPLFDFFMERLRRYYSDKGIANTVFDAVLALRPTGILDFHRRIEAVSKFTALAEAESLAAANKRIQNILRQNDDVESSSIDAALLVEPAEKQLATALADISRQVQPLLDNSNYEEVLTTLAGLRDAVDNFFDGVMVMCDDVALKRNRLALLGRINALFMSTADISKLQIQKG